jgi:hypothetical protein
LRFLISLLFFDENQADPKKQFFISRTTTPFSGVNYKMESQHCTAIFLFLQAHYPSGCVLTDSNLTDNETRYFKAFEAFFFALQAKFFLLEFGHMKNSNHTKKIAQLYYRDKILRLAKDGKSIREITDYINKSCISRSRFRDITLSKSTIHNLITKAKNVQHRNY